jgi:myo-inositol-hexaphosphate 3-phosphohydrolase
MKTKNIITALITLTALAAVPLVTAAEKEHKHEHADHDGDVDKNKKGPNGGILIHSVEPHAELLVTKDRKAKIVFVDDDNKAVAPDKQVVTAISGDRANPTRLTFAKGEGDNANALISDKEIPAGEHVDIVLQIKITPDAKTVTERLTLHLH